MQPEPVRVVRRRGRAVLPPALLVAATLGLAFTDWPLGWPFWTEHPFWTGLVQGAGFILFALVITDAYLRRRESRRWSSIGNVADDQLGAHFTFVQVAMLQMLGYDLNQRSSPDLDYHLIPAAERAQAVLGRDVVATPWGSATDALAQDRAAEERLPLLLPDERWRDSAALALQRFGFVQSQLLAQWAGIFTLMDDDDHFRSLGRTVTVLQLIEKFWVGVVAVQNTLDPQSPVDSELHDDAVSMVVQTWNSLRREVISQNAYWADRASRTRGSAGSPWADAAREHFRRGGA